MINISNEWKSRIKNKSVAYDVEISLNLANATEVIGSDKIVMDSVAITESISSQDEFRFGLCESSVFECQICSEHKDLRGIEIDVRLICKYEQEELVMPFGTYKIDEYRTVDAENGLRRLVAYSSIADKVSTTEVSNQVDEYTAKSYNLNLHKWFVGTYLNYNYGDSQYKLNLSYKGTERQIRRIPIFVDGYPYTRYFAYIEALYVEGTTDADEVVYIENGALQSAEYLFDFTLSWIEELSTAATQYADLNSYLQKYRYKLPSEFLNIAMDNNFPLYKGRMTANKTCAYAYGHGATIQIPEVFRYVITDLDGNVVYTKNLNRDVTMFGVYRINESMFLPMTKAIKFQKAGTKFKPNFTDVDMRSLFLAELELYGKVGRFTRDGKLEMVGIKKYPQILSNGIHYADESGETEGIEWYIGATEEIEMVMPSDYSVTSYENDFGGMYTKVVCQFDDGTDDGGYVESVLLADSGIEEKVYDISYNELVLDRTYTESQMQAYVDDIADKLNGIRYKRCSIDMNSRPQYEAGDMLEVLTKDEAFVTLVLRKVTRGLPYLVDSITAN